MDSHMDSHTDLHTDSPDSGDGENCGGGDYCDENYDDC
jgi:hypothetical protein